MRGTYFVLKADNGKLLSYDPKIDPGRIEVDGEDREIVPFEGKTMFETEKISKNTIVLKSYENGKYLCRCY